MSDCFSISDRRRIMRAVSTSKTDIEERMASLLRSTGVKFRRNDRSVLGTPDFAIHKFRLAVFVDGDFWHGRSWAKDRSAPASNKKFWIEKFQRNIARDNLVTARLRRSRWSVLRFWGSDVRRDPSRCIALVLNRMQRIRRERRVRMR